MSANMRLEQRELVTAEKNAALSVIDFRRFDRNDLIASVVDMSPHGIGIEGNDRMEPGFVWFHDKVDGSKGGLLIWSRELGGRYRGGIKLVPLSKEEEEQLDQKFAQGLVRDPLDIAETIFASLKRIGAGLIVQTH